MTDRPTVPEMAEWVREFYRMPGNEVGGSLHIVLDDKNLADHHVASCIEFARERGDAEGERLAETLARMSVTQRRKLANLPGKYAF